jgi:hypothetical protein
LIPDAVIGVFSLSNLSSYTVTLGFSQPLTEMSTDIILRVEGRQHVRSKISLPFLSHLSGKCKILDVPPACKLENLVAIFKPFVWKM